MIHFTDIAILLEIPSGLVRIPMGCGTFLDILTSRKRLRDVCSKQTGYAQRSLSAIKITYLKAFN
jgi:hypothetical protein